MAEQADEGPDGYKAPAVKSLDDILKTDQEDESLRRYKESLLGSLKPGMEVFPGDSRKVIVTKLSLVVPGRPENAVDLRGDLKKLKKASGLVLKEGCQYRLKVYFYVQREIVQGLKYVQKTNKKAIQVDKSTFMVGNFGPKSEEQFFMTPQEDAPVGRMTRGNYHVKSLFTDDDKHEYLKWEWNLEIKKDWE